MLSLFKRKADFSVASPVSGKLIELSEVSDPVFSKKLMGDGIAIIPRSNSNEVIVSSPVTGRIVSLPDTCHAFGVKTDDGREVLVHVGIDTVNLNGKGFRRYLKQGAKVSQGDKVIGFDPEVLKEQNLDDTVMVILVSGYDQSIDPIADYQSEVSRDQILLA